MNTHRNRQHHRLICLGVLMVVALFQLGSFYQKQRNNNSRSDLLPQVEQKEDQVQVAVPKPSSASNKLSTKNTSGAAFYKKRYATTPSFANNNNNKGYKPTGGALPLDTADYLEDPTFLPSVDNATCLGVHNSNSNNNNDLPQAQDWQRRAPFALLLGAMKAGTHAVTASLWEHPDIVPTTGFEMHFYDNSGVVQSDQGIDALQTRAHYAQSFQNAIPDLEFQQLKSNPKLKALESSPRYLIHSDRIPNLIGCVTPWVKLLAILRNPVDRVESHYRFIDQARRRQDKPMVDWDTWIAHDLRLLTQAGVLNNKTTNMTQEEEHLAWKTYQRRPGSYQIVGRGIYVIQLEQYLQTMKNWNISKNNLMVLQSERFRDPQSRQAEYDRLLDFLELAPHTLANTTSNEHVTERNALPMPDHIRAQLTELYAPYNQRLYQLLGWDHVWD